MSNPTVSNQTLDAFYSAIQSNVTNQFASHYNIPQAYVVVGNPAFEYNYMNGQSLFNQDTFDIVDSLAKSDPQGSGGVVLQENAFWTAYLQLVAGIGYQFSTADKTTLNQASFNAQQAGSTLVSDYEGQYGKITPQAMSAANTTYGIQNDKLDYILQYQLGYVWSGHLAATTTPVVTMQTMLTNSQQLAPLFPNKPATYQNILNDVSAYINAFSPGATLSDEQSQGNFTQAQILNNLQRAGLSYTVNGTTYAGPAAWTTFDPVSGNTSNLPYYQLSPVQEIVAGLQSGTQGSFQMNVSSADSSSWSLQIAGQAGGTVVFGDFLEWSGSNKVSYSVNSTQIFGSSYTITMQYTGAANAQVTPQGWQGTAWMDPNGNPVPTATVGWYDPSMLEQAFANYGEGANAVSGFNFVSAPAFDLDAFPEGDFNRVTNFILSNPPTVSITFNQGSYSSYQESFQDQTETNLSIFGISLASASSNYYQSVSQQNSSGNGFTLTFKPSSTANIPTYEASAVIVGVALESPAAG